MKNIYYIFIISLLTLSAISYGQNNGKIEIVQDSRIPALVEKHKQLNSLQKGVPGFRVQIFFASGNNSVPITNRIRAEFLAKYPRTKAYIVYQEPYYKVRVGDFRTRLEARGFLNIITHDFPSSYIVSDDVQLSE